MSKLADAVTNIRTLEELADRQSPVHALSPMAKLVTTLVYLVVVISFDRYQVSGLLPFVFYPVTLMAFAGIPYGLLLKRFLVAFPFAFFAGISNIFFNDEAALFIGQLTITYGWISFCSLMLKTLLTVMAVLILIATTSMTELSYQLLRLKIPPLMIMQLTITYRYLCVLLEEASLMYHGYLLRSPRAKGIKMKDMGTFAGQLLLRSIDRGERVYFAMKCRGFDGVCRFSLSGKAYARDYIYGIVISAALIFLRFMNGSQLLGSLFI